MSDDNRRLDLLTTIDNLLQARESWAASNEDDVLSLDFCDSMESALTVWREGSIPGDLRPAADRFSVLEQHWTEWLMTSEAVNGRTASPPSGHPLWKTLDLIQVGRESVAEQEAREVQYQTPIAELVRQGVGDRQICWMYRAEWLEGARTGPGLWDWYRNGPMIAKLAQEKAAPGCVIGDPVKFVPFHEVKRIETENRQRIAAERAGQLAQARQQRISQPDPTPLADLVAEGVSGQQIARMKRTTVEDIERQCREQGLPIPQRTYGVIKPGDGKFDPEPGDAQKRIEEARASAFQNRGRLAEMRQELPQRGPTVEQVDADMTAPTPDDFGGDPDMADVGDAGDTGADFDPAQNTTPSDLERRVAPLVNQGMSNRKIVAAMPNENPDSIRQAVGRLKGDPERMQAALDT